MGNTSSQWAAELPLPSVSDAGEGKHLLTTETPSAGSRGFMAPGAIAGTAFDTNPYQARKVEPLSIQKRSGTVLEVSTAGLMSQAMSEGRSPVLFAEPPRSIYTPAAAAFNTDNSARDLT